MRKRMNSKLLSLILCMMLIVATALSTVGCGQENGAASSEQNQETKESNDLGEGKHVFNLTVVDKDGNAKGFIVHTEKTTVGEALLELNIIEGDSSEFGLYVKKVDGITADYDTDGTYWAFYVNDEYATVGVDQTEIVDETSYSFKVEK